ncbi:MAG: hypothetical protein ACTSPD_21455 [Promethearchaeota archaeon]
MCVNNEISELILNWYREKGRLFPWRDKGRKPYEILIAEMLLQRTTAQNVKKYYLSFLHKFPNLKDIDNASLDELEIILKNLGLLKRGKFLKEIAKKLSSNEYIIPNSKEELMKLKGIGDYISSAIVTFGYDINTPIIDSNIKRISQRLWNIKNIDNIKNTLLKITKKQFKKVYFGLLDICWYFCRAPLPKCENCPLNKKCSYFKMKI